jgi:hypothetical protein
LRSKEELARLTVGAHKYFRIPRRRYFLLGSRHFLPLAKSIIQKGSMGPYCCRFVLSPYAILSTKIQRKLFIPDNSSIIISNPLNQESVKASSYDLFDPDTPSNFVENGNHPIICLVGVGACCRIITNKYCSRSPGWYWCLNGDLLDLAFHRTLFCIMYS